MNSGFWEWKECLDYLSEATPYNTIECPSALRLTTVSEHMPEMNETQKIVAKFLENEEGSSGAFDPVYQTLQMLHNDKHLERSSSESEKTNVLVNLAQLSQQEGGLNEDQTKFARFFLIGMFAQEINDHVMPALLNRLPELTEEVKAEKAQNPSWGLF